MVVVVAAAATAAAEGLMKLLFLLFSAQAGIFRVVFFPPATWQARPAWELRAGPELNAWTLFLLLFHTFIYLAFFNSINHCSYECGPIHLQSATINFNSLASRPWGNMTCLCPLRMCLLWTCFVLPVKCNALNESQGWSEYILLSATKRYYIHVQEVGRGSFVTGCQGRANKCWLCCSSLWSANPCVNLFRLILWVTFTLHTVCTEWRRGGLWRKF